MMEISFRRDRNSCDRSHAPCRYFEGKRRQSEDPVDTLAHVSLPSPPAQAEIPLHFSGSGKESKRRLSPA
jgi:hypothetical protein